MIKKVILITGASSGIGRHREKVVISTEFGNVRAADGTFLGIKRCPGYVREAVDQSLQSLSLYYQHHVDPNVPIEETIGAMAELITAGKVR